MKIFKIKGSTVFFQNRKMMLAEYIDFMDADFCEEHQIFEGHDVGGEYEQEREGLEYSPKLRYPSWDELNEDEVIQLLNWCYKNPIIFGAFESKEALIEEQAETYRDEILKMKIINESDSFLDDLQNWLKK
jgi:hypothetical protein